MDKPFFKKIFPVLLIIVLFLGIIPLMQSFIFQETTDGKLELNKKVEISFLPKSDNRISLVFFGYFGCTDVCTPVLKDLSRIYNSNEFYEYKKRVDVYFVNLLDDVYDFEPDVFAKYFNKDFKGIYLTKKEIMNIDRGFGLYFAPSLANPAQLDHTSFIYMVLKEDNGYILKKSYITTPINKKELIKDIKLELK